MAKKGKNSTATRRAYDYILKEILAGHFTVDVPISEEELAEKLSSSRTPIREALVALEKEGQVKRLPRNGWFVKKISTDDIEEVFELRRLMETYALKKSYGMLRIYEVEAARKRIADLSENDSPEAYFREDRELHGMIVRSCGNQKMVEVLGMLNMQIERLRILSAQKPERLSESRREHLLILDTLLKNDIETAEKLLAEHIDHIRDSVLEVSKYII